MGWKANSILICADDPAYFSSRPEIDHAKAKALLDHLVGPNKGTFEATTSFSDSVWPEPNCWAIGAYEKGYAISTRERNNFVVDVPRQVLKLIPNPYVLCIGLHSVSNYAGFAYYEKGKWVRRFASTQVDGLEVVEEGEKLPEEQAFWDRFSYTNEGWIECDAAGAKRRSDCAMGEDLVFAVCKKFLGMLVEEDGFYEGNDEEMFSSVFAVDVFRLPKKPWWKFSWTG